jgi:hypothetical protein
MLATFTSGAPFLATALSTALVFYLCHRFLRTLHLEAPQVYAELGSPSIGKYLWSNDLLTTFSNFILSREYRSRLAQFPKSRAWASWLHWAHWLQILALLWLLVSVITR